MCLVYAQLLHDYTAVLKEIATKEGKVNIAST
jgi:hypothetical protein